MGKVKILNLYPGSWSSNCYLLISDGHALCIDPSAHPKTVMTRLSEENAVLDAILMTHGHFDHITFLDSLKEMTGAQTMIHEFDDEMLADAKKSAFYHFFGEDRTYAPADKKLHGGDTICFGSSSVKVIHTPGHSKGSVCYLGDDFIITGDTLFAADYGRFDLYGGDRQQLVSSLTKLGELDGTLKIYPGHGAYNELADALDRVFI